MTLDIDGTLDRIRARKNTPKDLSISSLPQLDDMLWGIPKGELTIIGARPSNGKTSLAYNILLDLLQQRKNILFFSWDDTKDSMIKRLISLYGLVDNELIKRGNFGSKESDHKAIAGLKNILIKEHLSVIDTRGRTADAFRRLCEKPTKLDCVFVDYLQLVKTQGYPTEKAAFDGFLKVAKDISRERGCGMVILSQINRSGAALDKDRKVYPPMMHELKGSGDCEQDAKVVLLLHWDWFYTKDETAFHEYKIKIEKNKDSRTGVISAFYYPQYYKISEVPLDGHYTDYVPKSEATNEKSFKERYGKKEEKAPLSPKEENFFA